MDFSLFYFADDSEAEPAGDRYALLLEGARFADQHGFRAVWTPERHFHSFGGLYPNPSVVGAALATVTERVHIRAGSVVAPLHHPLRIAEEWAVVDNLSRGRAGVSFASGWNVADFCFAPEAYPDRKAALLDQIQTVRALWRGEHLDVVDGVGDKTRVRVYPRPVQPELPVWITSGGDPETFRAAGEAGFGLLTHLLGQDMDQLAAKIAVYRQAAEQAEGQGRSGARGRAGHVVAMVHAFVGDDDAAVREQVRAPLSAYLRSSLDLARSQVDAAHPLSREKDHERAVDIVVAKAFDRYVDGGGLLGGLDTCLSRVRRLQEIGVDEVACLIDFGLPADQVLGGLDRLDLLRRMSQAEADSGPATTPS
ncbi:LLM class flavin-dependent oxidoreductase [Planotetraspora sp. A-T 1434]|uniref:MupA/Atu3671 family FMN-dependent luciferase-like monooxygenase n=1 Tax=Planotetraspora sp. A-T 1434 TaxID=2979219 RepID=UPI0021BF66D9|nr:MupA/Atu3671 family FMN-dependent luciferase-like monooxygenase [Planotetraspora sp. A-T 1434]MCT9935257.1 LLM class flavin-dependent oxidoreductase [Planotetraspora sp. A-T 1434]